jgi:O-antigen biosynthesis protein
MDKFKNVVFQSYIGDTQGCGTIRVIYPYILLPHLQIPGFLFTGFYTAYFIRQIDYYQHITFTQFQRAATEVHLALIKEYKSTTRKVAKTPIIYETDDNLTDIPEWNYAHDFYNHCKKYVTEMLPIVDGITTSTPYMKEMLLKYNPRVEVIPNHLPKFIWGDVRPKHDNNPRERKPRILWAGSQNHFARPGTTIEGGDFGKEIIEFIKKTTNKYQWVLSGALPVELMNCKDKIEVHEWKNIFAYPSHMKSLDPDICIAPLLPCVFNDCKSNIKCLEYTAIGAPAVYTYTEPYKDMTLATTSEDQMIDEITKLGDSIDYRKEVYCKDYEIVKDQLFWEDNDFKNLKEYVNSYFKLFGKPIL